MSMFFVYSNLPILECSLFFRYLSFYYFFPSSFSLLFIFYYCVLLYIVVNDKKFMRPVWKFLKEKPLFFFIFYKTSHALGAIHFTIECVRENIDSFGWCKNKTIETVTLLCALILYSIPCVLLFYQVLWIMFFF